MLKVFIALFVMFAMLLVSEYLYRRKILHGELSRKLAHIAIAAFVAFWPWLMSWRTIQLIGLGMVFIMLLNRQLQIFHFPGNIRHNTYGEVFLALAITTTALLTNNKIFFAVAILMVALGDGMAAIIGTKFGQKWKYRVFNQTKTVIGSMTFWVVALCILGVGLLPAYSQISLSHYDLLLIAAPPLLAVVENVAVYGMDNLALPLATILILQIAQTGA